MALLIEQVDPRGAHAMGLLREAALEARALYADVVAPTSAMPTNPPAELGSVYLVAYDAHVPVGCAALRAIDPGTAEVRRVFVRKTARGAGVARALMAQLETEALRLGYGTLQLETGNRQHAAMALYHRLGFRRIAAFGAYTGDPTSVCFAKVLNGG